MRKLILATRLTALALLLFCGVALKAQVVTTGNINGVVTDPTGAVIAGATITATDTDTNEQTVTTTDKAGVYNLRFLQVGNYTVTFKAPGFGEQITPQFVLEVDQSAERNAKMTPGGGSTQISVQAERAPLLNTENSTIATSLDARAISDIPLMGRSLTDLQQFEPGVVSTSATSSGTVEVNGSRGQGNNYVLNGLETNENINYGQTYNVNPDAVLSLQETTATPSAEYGNVEGGTFLTLIKSGTNQFHGNAFMNLRNYLLDAFSWGAKHTTGTIAPRSPYTDYQMGGTLGGPIIRNKLFAFGDYQGVRNHSTSHGFATVPTFDERGCSGGLPGSVCTGGTTADFSELLDPYVMCNNGGTAVSGSGTVSPSNPNCTTSNGNSKLIQLFDPFGAAPGYPNNGFTPFAGNKGIPINNPVVKYLFAHNNLLPLPGSQLGINGAVFNTTGNPIIDGINTNSAEPGAGNVSTTTKAFSHTNQYDVKIDYRLSSKDNLSGSFSYANTLGYTTPTIPINFPSEAPTPIKIITFDDIHTFSPAIVNDLRLGYQRYVNLAAATIDTSGVFGTQGDSVLGIGSAAGSAVAQAYQGYAGQTQTAAGTQTGTLTTPRSGAESEGGTSNTGSNIVENTFLYADNLTWLRGKHTYKIGVNIGRYQQNNFYPGNDGSLGALLSTGLFSSNQISNKADPRYPTSAMALKDDTRGYAYADYVMDRMSGATIGGVAGPVGMRQNRNAYFINDDWKIRPNLTLNLGLRYEYNTQIHEVNNKYVAPDIITQTLILAGTPQANAYCGGCGTTLVHPFYGGLVPRVGFNWAYTPRTVISAGYGAMTFMEGTGANLRMTTNPPFQTALEYAASVPDVTGVTGTPYTEEQGFTHVLPGAAASGALINLWDLHVRPAYVQTYSLGVQYQMSNSLSFSLKYVGKTGQHLITPGSANELPQPCTNPAFVAAGNPTGINTKVSTITTDTTVNPNGQSCSSSPVFVSKA